MDKKPISVEKCKYGTLLTYPDKSIEWIPHNSTGETTITLPSTIEEGFKFVTVAAAGSGGVAGNGGGGEGRQNTGGDM